MKITETVTEPRQVEKIISHTCDICGAARERFCARLQAMADALASYLPPHE